jgi:hypothetical protein
MTQEYALWEWEPNGVRNTCSLEKMLNFDDSYHFALGTQLASTFPDNVQIRMDPNTPRDNVLTDYLQNIDSILVVSDRLKTFFEERHLKCVEYLPVTILDHKGKPARARYFIANTYDHVDCLDVTVSKPKYGHIRKESIKSVQRLVLDPQRVDAERELFVIKNFSGPILVRTALANAITQAKFTGIQWRKLEEYSRLG